MAKTNVGTMKCSECQKEVVVKINENETLSYTCSWCDDANYARVGTPKYNAWQNRITDFKPAAPAKAAPSSSGLLV